MKKILVLGGSYLQSYFIQTAVKMGNEVFVLDRNKHCYARTIESISFSAIDISDEREVERFFIEKECDLIVSPVTEIGNRIAAGIADRHGLCYNSLEAVKATTDKRVMRSKLENQGLNEPKYEVFKSVDHIKKNFSFPLIVKPAVNSASRGVSLVSDEKSLQPALNEALKFCHNKSQIVIEEYIEGKQYSIETISGFGEHFIVGVTREFMSAPPYFIERTDVITTDDTARLYNKLQEYVEQILNILGVVTGPCHIEVKIRDGDIYLIEVASRSGLLRDRLVEAANGSSYNKLIIKAYSGEKIRNTDIKKTSSNSLLGIIMTPQDLEVYFEVKKKDLLIDEYFNGKSPEQEPKRLTDAFGYFFITGGNDIFDYKLV